MRLEWNGDKIIKGIISDTQFRGERSLAGNWQLIRSDRGSFV